MIEEMARILVIIGVAATFGMWQDDVDAGFFAYFLALLYSLDR